ncbi:MAG: (2Fe-2S)-binding protein [Lachnospiraceae bacterium]
MTEKLRPEKKETFIETRKDVVNPFHLPEEERNALIASHPEYGNVICRCETVTEGQIIDAIRRPLGARSLDGVKRRTRAGMGRCQAGFCSPRTMEIPGQGVEDSHGSGDEMRRKFPFDCGSE